MTYPSSVQKLIEKLRHLPGVGPKTAVRYAFHLVHSDPQQVKELRQSLADLKKVKLCDKCFKPFEASKNQNICSICRNDKRDKSLLCVVEKEADLNSIEETQSYQGLYFIIGEARLFFDSEELKRRAEKLFQRIKKTSSPIEEVILAINPTPEGQALYNYLKRQLNKEQVKISHLRQGLPRGAELEYADAQTLRSALTERKIDQA